MNNFARSDTTFSLCGLNCGLCVMRLGNYCPGCGGGEGNQPCAITRCSQKHGFVEYCFLCDEYPCKRYACAEKYDSFITHRNQLKDFERVRKIGIVAYQIELAEKIKILEYFLENFNDGRRKSFFCLAVNLLELQDIKAIVKQIESETVSDNLTIKEKAKIAANCFNEMASKRDITLKLNRKTEKETDK